MIKYVKISALILFCTCGLSYMVQSQARYKIKEGKDSEITLSGTSTLHDWQMDSYSTSGEAELILDGERGNDLTSITSLTFSLPVKSLKSENQGLNNNAYDVLKADEHKNIVYTLTSSTLFAENGGYLVKSTGDLTVAGVTREITMDVHTLIKEDKMIACRGSYSLKMTDYKVTPPSFMWGAMKTGDAITLNFVVVYEK